MVAMSTPSTKNFSKPVHLFTIIDSNRERDFVRESKMFDQGYAVLGDVR
jgi:hypothetical protein